MKLVETSNHFLERSESGCALTVTALYMHPALRKFISEE